MILQQRLHGVTQLCIICRVGAGLPAVCSVVMLHRRVACRCTWSSLLCAKWYALRSDQGLALLGMLLVRYCFICCHNELDCVQMLSHPEAGQCTRCIIMKHLWRDLPYCVVVTPSAAAYLAPCRAMILASIMQMCHVFARRSDVHRHAESACSIV